MENKLFSHLYQAHGLTLTEDELHEVRRVVREEDTASMVSDKIEEILQEYVSNNPEMEFQYGMTIDYSDGSVAHWIAMMEWPKGVQGEMGAIIDPAVNKIDPSQAIIYTHYPVLSEVIEECDPIITISCQS